MSRSRSGSGSPSFRNQRGAYRQSRGGASFTANSTANNNNNNNPETVADNGDSPEPRKGLTIQRRSMQPEESSTAPTFSIHISNLPFSVDKD